MPCSLFSIPQLINLCSRSHCSDYLSWLLEDRQKELWLRPWHQYKLDWNVIRDSAILTAKGWLMPDGYKQKGKPHCLLETRSEKKIQRGWALFLAHMLWPPEREDWPRAISWKVYSFLALRTVFAFTEHSMNKCAIIGWINDAYTICSKPFSIIICKTVYFLTRISHIYLELLFASTPRMKQWGSILLWNQSKKKNPENQKRMP